MDILYLTPNTVDELAKYCEKDLIAKVIEHFMNYGEVITKNGGKNQPIRIDGGRSEIWWIITDYISNETIDSRQKLSVILSLAAIGGIIQIGDNQAVGDVNVICMLNQSGYISEDDFDYFVESFFNFARGEGVKFSL